MPAQDRFHEAVKNALIRDGWTITDDRLRAKQRGDSPMATVAADKLTMYRDQIESVIREYASYKYSHGDIEREAIIDRQHDHYELMSIGWIGAERVHGCVLHIDIKNGKIWIQHDGTEEGVANRFVEAGVPKEDIVLAFHSPFSRQFTGYAVE